MTERRGAKALELWCRRITEGYSGVKVDNMTTSWRDGLAFCALIHHFKPDLIDFPSLKKEDVYYNNELAFRTAESYLGIPALLDAEDMAQYDVPDRLSILTYLSQYYQHFASAESPNRLSGKRPSTSTEHSPLPPSPSSSSPPTKMMSGGLGRREPCVACGQPVFLAQRLLVEKRLYHRTCFSCVRCGAQLTLASYHRRHADPEGHFSCETCPDEESDSPGDDTNSEDTASNQDAQSHDNVSNSEYNQVLSDEEKVRNIQQFKEALAAERLAFDESLEKKIERSSDSSKAFSGFLKSQFEDRPPALPPSSPPKVIKSEFVDKDNVAISQVSTFIELPPPSDSVNKDNYICNSDLVINNELESNEDCADEVILSHSNAPVRSDSNKSGSTTPVPLERKSKYLSNVETSPTPAPRGISATALKSDIHIEDNPPDTQPVIDILQNSPSKDDVVETTEASIRDDEFITKDREKSEKPFDDKPDVDVITSLASSGLSLVKSRMKLFETQDPGDVEKKISNQDSSSNIVDQDNTVVSSCKISDKEQTEENNCTSNNSDKLDSSLEGAAATQREDPPCSRVNISTSISKLESQTSAESNNVPFSSSPKPYADDSTNIVDTEITQNGDVSVTCSDVVKEVIHSGTDDDVNRIEENATVSEELNILKQKEDDLHTGDEAKTSDVANSDSESESNNDNKNPFDDVSEVDSRKESDLAEENIVEDEVGDNTSSVADANKVPPSHEHDDTSNVEYPEDLNPFCSDEETPTVSARVSTNPFGSCSEDEEENVNLGEKKKKGEKPPRPPPPAIMVHTTKERDSDASDQKKKIIPATNPFDSDDDSEEEDVKGNFTSLTPRLKEAPPSHHGSTSSLVGTYRRKKAPAPRPPTQQVFSTPPQNGLDSTSSVVSTPTSQTSPQVSPRSRKRRPAPPPPTTSSPLSTTTLQHLQVISSPIAPSCPSPQSEYSRNNSISSHKRVISAAEFDEQDLDRISGEWSGGGLGEVDKNEASISSGKASPAFDRLSLSKGIFSKHRKGPAPAVPRYGTRGAMSVGALRRELALLEEQQRGLERQGVRLETLIRERTEGKEPPPEGVPDVETDELLLQLFDLVNEKNELFRRQAELMYLRKQQRLEEEQTDLEQQVRVLMCVEESNKTDADKQREEALLSRLMDVVQRRDQVVAALERERLREKAEDQAVRERMTLHRAKLEELSSVSSADTHIHKKEKKKKKHWMKKDKLKKSEKAEGEGDIIKKAKHKKWFK